MRPDRVWFTYLNFMLSLDAVVIVNKKGKTIKGKTIKKLY